MQLTPHFNLNEFTKSKTAVRLGVSNKPNVAELANLHRLAETLEKVRALVGRPLNISSGFRCQAVNDATPGSSKTSAHRRGLAADFTVNGIGVKALCLLIRESTVEYDQLIYEGEWVHLGLSTGAPRREELTAHFGGPRTVYTKGIK